MSYKSSLKPIPESELSKIVCWGYVNEDVQDMDLEKFDQYFIDSQGTFGVYTTHKPDKSETFTLEFGETEIPVDWRVYRTWNNTFHLRYRDILISNGIKHNNPHIAPEDRFRIVRALINGNKPLTLKMAIDQFIARDNHCPTLAEKSILARH